MSHTCPFVSQRLCSCLVCNCCEEAIATEGRTTGGDERHERKKWSIKEKIEIERENDKGRVLGIKGISASVTHRQ